MRKLVIFDPNLISLEGHYYNYDLAISEAAQRRFDEVTVYADRRFRDVSGRLPNCRPTLNRLRMTTLKRWTNAVFRVLGFGRRSDASVSAHASVLPSVWGWLISLGKWLRAKDLEWVLRAILRRELRPGDEVHIFLQHAHLWDLMLAERLSGPAHLHLLLRYSPELVNANEISEVEFARLLARLGRAANVHLYTDSERLSAQYRAAGVREVTTLPVPILLAESVGSWDTGHRQAICVAFLGPARIEKGFAELAFIIERFPREVQGQPVVAMVQMTRSSDDPRVRDAVRELDALAARLPPGSLRFLDSPAAMDQYYRWVAESSIVVMPYLSKKYNASTSGVFVEAVSFGVPVICPDDSWMADVLAEAARDRKLRIGEVFTSIEEIPAATARIAARLPEYRDAVRQFAAYWRRTHNAEECVRLLAQAAT